MQVKTLCRSDCATSAQTPSPSAAMATPATPDPRAAAVVDAKMLLKLSDFCRKERWIEFAELKNTVSPSTRRYATRSGMP